METVPDIHRAHREEFEQFVLAQAEPWHREYLTASMRPGMPTIGWLSGGHDPALSPLGRAADAQAPMEIPPATGFGARLQIRLRPSLLRGTHPVMARGARIRAASSALCRMSCCMRPSTSISWKFFRFPSPPMMGMACCFVIIANTIGAHLGLPPVRASKVRARDRTLLSCAQWPHTCGP